MDAYWQRPGPTRMVFPVIPTGSAPDDPSHRVDRRHCVMFGKSRQGLPEGWHLVAINGKHLYGKFVAVALNVLKTAPVDSQEVPNVLTEELRALFGGKLPGKPRVRFVRQTAAAVWEVLAV